MMVKLSIAESEESFQAVQEITHVLGIEITADGIPVSFMKAENPGIRFDGSKCEVSFSKKHQVIREIGLLVERLHKGEPFELRECPSYEDLGMMADCSRNAVPTVKAVKKLIRHLALMGYSSLQLYTEDTYEIPEYPYFGYLRGRYTAKELQEIDRYAELFGIELVPCIQTLAHLRQIFQWQAFREIWDIDDILLAGNEETYRLIDAMFRVMSENIRSRRINIGMDEAHLVGLGNYLAQHGYQDRFEIMLNHLNRVLDIAKKYGYHVMMWSDMFFRLATGGEYYRPDAPLKQEVLEKIPKDVTLVYWDYYSTKKETYDSMIRKHKEMCGNIAFAGGAWKWTGFCPNADFSLNVGQLADESCRENGVKQVLITAWGDDGGEASVFSILPALQLWAELCYTGNADPVRLLERFDTCVRGRYEDFMSLSLPVCTPDNNSGNNMRNPTKYQLYQDVLYGMFDRHVQADADSSFYRNCAATLSRMAGRNPLFGELFETQAALCLVLEVKCGAGIRLREAYRAKDRRALQWMASEELPRLLERLALFEKAYARQWDAENKPFGLDVFDLRIGGLKRRVERAISRINRFLSGELEAIEELEEDILPYDCTSGEGKPYALEAPWWGRICTPGVI